MKSLYIFVLLVAGCVTTTSARALASIRNIEKRRIDPGVSGLEQQGQGGPIDILYGNGYLPKHMRHVETNLGEHPANNGPFKLAKNPAAERKASMKGWPRPPKGSGLVRDEKPPAMFANRQQGQVTMEMLPKTESSGPVAKGLAATRSAFKNEYYSRRVKQKMSSCGYSTSTRIALQ